ncbi:MAG: hypothetical protein KME60_07125 [Cyanomargarita calcarea GSE-NOS-MK-12-04C]|jgi:hypothetical protein|uniref:Uncharacterized protein n=1 Tax=Cyanomargarita calcarea GSE-NOS-MK-12-04C TaxID=2839659 RepID=A0A951QJS7_9CYAN|nr:hypothetical protein [Cyanomargarita calcarea GSE-NOS-MK-12-04C]
MVTKHNDGDNDSNWQKVSGHEWQDTKLQACSSQELWLLEVENSQDREEEVSRGWAQYDSRTNTYYGTGDDD